MQNFIIFSVIHFIRNLFIILCVVIKIQMRKEKPALVDKHPKFIPNYAKYEDGYEIEYEDGYGEEYPDEVEKKAVARMTKEESRKKATQARLDNLAKKLAKKKEESQGARLARVARVLSSKFQKPKMLQYGKAQPELQYNYDEKLPKMRGVKWNKRAENVEVSWTEEPRSVAQNANGCKKRRHFNPRYFSGRTNQDQLRKAVIAAIAFRRKVAAALARSKGIMKLRKLYFKI